MIRLSHKTNDTIGAQPNDMIVLANDMIGSQANYMTRSQANHMIESQTNDPII